jgi:hypothetical protein
MGSYLPESGLLECASLLLSDYKALFQEFITNVNIPDTFWKV